VVAVILGNPVMIDAYQAGIPANGKRDGVTSMHHPTCTAKMGRDDMSVVDSKLRVYGISQLRVADGSIMPAVTTGNTPGTVRHHRRDCEWHIADTRCSCERSRDRRPPFERHYLDVAGVQTGLQR
jgi:hypothetical protein